MLIVEKIVKEKPTENWRKLKKPIPRGVDQDSKPSNWNVHQILAMITPGSFQCAIISGNSDEIFWTFHFY